MTPYLRPEIESPIFRDDDGHVIDYGHRWPGSPPDDTYSVERDTERFAPLHAVADALITHLASTYDVRLQEGTEVAADLLHPHHDVERAVRVTPNDSACAALTFVFTGFPGILLHAGLLHDFRYPPCGCEACDEEWSDQADGLERQVLAVVTGNYREGVGRGCGPWIESETTFDNGSSSSQSRGEDVPAERRSSALEVLAGRSGPWAAWPLAPMR